MKILLVAPYLELVKTAEDALADSSYQTRIVFGDLQEGLEAANGETLTNSPDVVISRGGTASLLRQNLSIPVFEIDVTVFDLLRAIFPHAKKKRKVAVVGYENVVNGARILAGIIEVELGYFLITNQDETGDLLEKAKAWGADVVVGDAVSVKTAGQKGLNSELIRSGPEAIKAIVESAVQFYEHMQVEIIRNKRLNSILEHSDKGVLYLNMDNSIELINLKAESILGLSRYQVVGRRIDDLPISESLARSIKDLKNEKLIKIGENDYIVEVFSLQSDVFHSSTIVFLQSTGAIRDKDVLIRKQMINRGLTAALTFNSIITRNPRFRKIMERAQIYSKTNSTVLLLGETGSGKEIFAQSIHNASSRRNGPFVGVNCAALPDTLLESELFGYAEGAFTGALKGGKPGLFETAHQGSIFLDEVNDMSKDVQARLLRVLQEKQVMRVGDNKIFDVDVRIIAASNKNLALEVEAGRFREDLFYRLKVLDLELIPLRSRKEDILPLFRMFIKQFFPDDVRMNFDIPEELESGLVNYHWPGNIRELKNFAEKISVLLSVEGGITETVVELFRELEPGAAEEDNSEFRLISDNRSLKELEGEIIRNCLERNSNNISRTARELGIDRATLRKKINLKT